MQKTIQTLKYIVRNASTPERAAQNISSQFRKVSPRLARGVVIDVRANIEGELTQNELSLFLIKDGFV